MKIHRYATTLALIAFISGAILSSPGCSACPDVASKICEKACACGSDCVVGAGSAAFKSGSNAACVTAYTAQCFNQAGVDFTACSTALDTAKCDDNGAVVLPTECTTAPSPDGGSGAGGGGGAGSSGSSASGSK